jgi:hypothetical protein
MDHNPPILHFLRQLRWQVCITMPSYWLRWGSCELFACCGQPGAVIILISPTQVARMTGMSHHA